MKLSVLIVDDEPTVPELLEPGLSQDGFSVTTCCAGEEALVLAELRPFDAALVDVGLPGIDGLEVLFRLRALRPDTAVVMMTGSASVDIAVQAMQSGAHDYVTKPFSLADVSLRLRRAMELCGLQRLKHSHVAQMETAVAERTAELAQKNAELQALLLGAIASLQRLQELKERYSSGHSQRVAARAGELAPACGLSGRDAHEVRLAALLHDIGKAGIPDAILQRPTRLSDQEYRRVCWHPVVGADILEPIGELRRVAALVRHHHEHWDGRGYPGGLRGEEIPLGSRIIAVADAFDAMTSPRPYRPAMTWAHAARELEGGAGSQWDPEVVRVFLSRSGRSAAPGEDHEAEPTFSSRGGVPCCDSGTLPAETGCGSAV
jgi:putative nucleotidyltransferase with HDIG domain